MSISTVVNFAFGPSAGGGVDPGTASNLHVQFNADTDVFENAAGDDPAENGDVVHVWKDQSTPATNATQTASGDRPLFIASHLDGQPAIDFLDDSNQAMDVIGSDAALANFTILAVIEPDDFADEYTIMGPDTSGGIQFRFGTGATAGDLEILKSGVSLVGGSTTPATSAAMNIVSCTMDSSGNFAFYLNGVAVGTGTNSTTFVASAWTIANRGFSSGEALNGQIMDIYVFSDVKTSAEIIDFMTFLNAKYSDLIY